MTPYSGFDIDNQFRIFKDGKQIFTAWHQRCCAMEEAKATIDISNQAKLQRLPSLSVPLLPLITDEDEARELQLQSESERLESYYELDILDRD